ncbi:hypothetical protein BV741P4_00006 [Phocaeicola phage BV741P4]|nr:hypothetical protein BV741P4_00006 [Phocaeicola phage BV741P4]
MRITYINTGNSVGNQTNYVAPIVIPIAAGLKQELLFEDMTAVTNMQIGVYRNGALVHQQQLVPSSTMRIDLSTFAQVLPSLNELYKYLASDTSSNVQDMIQFRLQDGGTARTYTTYVCSLNCPYLNSRGWVHHDERNLVSTALASMVDVSLVGQGVGTHTKESVTDSVRGTGTRITGAGDEAWVYDLPRSGATIAAGAVVTQSVYVENTGVNPFQLRFNFGANIPRVDIPVGFKGVVYASSKLVNDYAPYIYVVTINGKPMEANFYTYMLNYGSEPKPWIKAGANAASPCVGAMTDYRSGRGFNIWQVTENRNSTENLNLTGVRKISKTYYSVGSDPAGKDVVNATGSANFFSGFLRWDTDTVIRISNPDGTVYGWVDNENKLPKDVSPSCGVLLKWLNSKGRYDAMFFEKYSIKPVMRTNNSGGNGIDYYETTVQIDVNWDNEPCLNWIQRSSDIIARIPIDVCQFGRATLLATNVFQTQGGNKTKTIQFKFKVQIVEP